MGFFKTSCTCTCKTPAGAKKSAKRKSKKTAKRKSTKKSTKRKSTKKSAKRKGGSGAVAAISKTAKRIRKNGETWRSAIKRASRIVKKEQA